MFIVPVPVGGAKVQPPCNTNIPRHLCACVNPSACNRALKHGDLPEDERRRVQVTWLMQCVRGSEHVLRREGIDIPQEIFGTDKERPQNIAGYRVR